MTTIEYKRRRKTNQKHNTICLGHNYIKKTGLYQEHANHDLPCNTKHWVKRATSGSAIN